MIRKSAECTQFSKVMFGGPGEAQFKQILNEGEFRDKGRLFNQVVFKPGTGIGTHRHTNDFEIYYILSGTGLYNDNGTEVQMEAGDVAICPEGQQHSMFNNGTEDLVMIALILFDKKN